MEGILDQVVFNEPLTLGVNLIFCGHETCRPGHTFGPAIRTHYLFHYIAKGSGKLYIGDRYDTLKEGDGFMIHPGETTLYAADYDTPWEYYWLAFDGKDVEKLLTSCGLGQGLHLFTAKEHDLFLEAFTSIFYKAMTGTWSYYELLGQFYKVLSLMVQDAKDRGITNDQYVDQTIKLIQKNYAYDLKVSDLAKSVGLERSYLYRLFARTTGVSIKDYLTKYRLEQARLLLETKSTTITQVAYSTGFKSSSAFCKHFSAVYHQSPSHYKKDLSFKSQFVL